MIPLSLNRRVLKGWRRVIVRASQGYGHELGRCDVESNAVRYGGMVECSSSTAACKCADLLRCRHR